MNIEQKPAPFIINRETKIFLVLDHLPLATDETALLAAPDEIL